ncbi:gamma-glutamylcyclotransferase family protein [Galbibacter mesophilus]|uniref:gamma-glutamylcyclotransferase family protein n=1 Tax=Galbibacter mesophilus TaxID=379069 RepID=UPI00191CC831|nr:gamma-glutamylcyclotransferase family protein [Galbibacter mesophilus]MCM5663666.1 gamma-glutamylcyclotransferase [Galbibacter mesophilus]
MYVFVYGTLMQGFDNPVAQFLRKHSDFIGNGSTPGVLYDLGSFPGAIFDTSSPKKIQGEVYKITKNTEAVLAALDQYEGIDDPSFNYYQKNEAHIKTDIGEINAMVYNFINPIQTYYHLIASGDYRNHLENQ